MLYVWSSHDPLNSIIKDVVIAGISEIKQLIFGLSCDLKMATIMGRPTMCKTKLYFKLFLIKLESWNQGNLYFYTFNQTEPKITPFVENNQPSSVTTRLSCKNTINVLASYCYYLSNIFLFWKVHPNGKQVFQTYTARHLIVPNNAEYIW